MIQPMSFFSERFVAHLDSIGWGEYGLNQRFEQMSKEQKLSEQYVYSLCRGEQNPKVETLQKISNVPGIGLSLPRLKGWRAVDVYGADAIIEAFKELEMAEPKLISEEKEEAYKRAGKEKK